MTSTADNTIQLESEFLSGVEANLEQAKGKLLRGTIWRLTREDEADRLRNLMAKHKKFDSRLYTELPKNRRAVMQSFKRPWWLIGKRRVGVAIASVLSPLEWYVNQGSSTGTGAPPIGSRELLDHVRSLQVDPKVPHIVGLCSPTGFSPEALEARSELGNVTLVLVEPAETGGWRVVGGDDSTDPHVKALFDPEDASGKHRRVAQYLESRSADLLTGGLSATQVAEHLGVSNKIVCRALEEIARQDPELHSSLQDGELLIYRGAAAETKEPTRMSMVDRIRQLFSRDGDERQKINELSKRRAALSHRRDRLYDDIIQLEKREADLLDQGRQNKSQVVRRRIAAQLAQLRKDIQRQNATASMLNKQIEILSTDVHNLTLLQQGQMAELPSSEALTENAVAAEEMLEGLQADAELVGSLETGLADSMTTDEERAILEEFDAPPAVAQDEPTPSPASPLAEEVPPAEEPPKEASSREDQKRSEPESS